MKTILFVIAILAAFPISVTADEKEADFLTFRDPRKSMELREWLKDGEILKESRNIKRSLLIIAWNPNPMGKVQTYQISGIDGYFSQKRIDDFLNEFYKLYAPVIKNQGEHLNVIIAGNNWGAGMFLQGKLLELSKEYKFSVFYAGGWAFNKAVLIDEPDDRLKMIKAAFEKTEEIDKKTAE